MNVKLQASRLSLEYLLSVKEWESTGQPLYFSTSNSTSLSTSNATSGSSIATSVATSVPAPHIQAVIVSKELDNFFESLATAYDVLAQIVNLMYLSPPLAATNVYFLDVVDTLRSRPRTMNEPLTAHLVQVRKTSYYREMMSFRRCATHDKPIDYKISYESSFQPLRENYPLKFTVKSILLPDNPRAKKPDYKKGKSVNVLCVYILEKTIGNIEAAFELMNGKLLVANKIPV
jgi:hypothetical protein